MTITIPESHRKRLEEQARRVGTSVDELVVRLIEDAFDSDEIEAELLKTVNGSSPEPMTQSDWDFLFKRIADRNNSPSAG
jgi:hypothetical protein